MRLATALAVILLSAAPTTHAADIIRTPRGEAIDRYMTRLAAFGISGALYVAKDGKTIVQRGYGVANRSTGARVTADEPFLIGSLSKQFTAADERNGLPNATIASLLTLFHGLGFPFALSG